MARFILPFSHPLCILPRRLKSHSRPISTPMPEPASENCERLCADLFSFGICLQQWATNNLVPDGLVSSGACDSSHDRSHHPSQSAAEVQGSPTRATTMDN